MLQSMVTLYVYKFELQNTATEQYERIFEAQFYCAANIGLFLTRTVFVCSVIVLERLPMSARPDYIFFSIKISSNLIIHHEKNVDFTLMECKKINYNLKRSFEADRLYNFQINFFLLLFFSKKKNTEDFFSHCVSVFGVVSTQLHRVYTELFGDEYISERKQSQPIKWSENTIQHQTQHQSTHLLSFPDTLSLYCIKPCSIQFHSASVWCRYVSSHSNSFACLFRSFLETEFSLGFLSQWY